MPEVAEGRMQQAGAVLVHPAEIDLIGPFPPAVLRKLLLRQPALTRNVPLVVIVASDGVAGKAVVIIRKKLFRNKARSVFHNAGNNFNIHHG